MSIALILREFAEQQPHATALMAPGRPPLDYRSLCRQTEYVGSQLRANDVGRGSRVCVVLANGPEVASCCIGVSAWAICAPTNPGYTGQEFVSYFSDLRADAVILAQGDEGPARRAAQELGLKIFDLTFTADMPAGSFTLATVGRQAPDTTERPTSAALDPPTHTDIALVFPTSGTTAKPKIVPLSHGNLCVSVSNIAATLNLGSSDRCINVMPLFHIHGIMAALLATLASGGSVVCTGGFDNERFFRWVNEFQPTWYSAVPTIHQAVLQIGHRYREIAASHQFRFVRSSSAALAPASLEAMETLFAAPVIEAYGMTEAAHQMASNPLPPGRRKPGSVGLPAGPQIAIMDAGGQILPQGALGEVVIRGENVTSGYDGNAAANTAAFSAGWFRTGDEGRLDEDGYLFLTGRLKEIINRGGEKIAPKEVDEVLLQHPDVFQAVAFAVKHPSLGEDLAAAVVLREGATTSPQALRHHCFSYLADYKVPSKILVLDAIPKTASGKVQRLALAQALADELASAYVPATTETEVRLVRIVSEVLNRPRVGIQDNFFSLGGNSLQATRVVNRINSELDVALPVPSVFHYPTVEELARTVDGETAQREETIRRAITEIESLSEEEVERLLREL